MKIHFLPWVATLLLSAALARGADSIEETMKRATTDYGQRLRQANEELARARERIAREKIPLLKAMRAAEDRITAAGADTTRLETAREQSEENQRKAVRDLETLRKTLAYVNGVAQDSMTTFESGFRPGEEQFLAEKILPVQEGLTSEAASARSAPALAGIDFLLGQVQLSVGGHTAPGTSLIEGNNRLVPGTFAFAGPEVFFLPGQGASAGTVRRSDEGGPPVTYLLPAWKPEWAQAFFQGRRGPVLADSTGGKALRLAQAKGTLWQHVKKGGVVSFAIIGVGLLALGLFLQKVRDLSQLRVASRESVKLCLAGITAGNTAAVEKSVAALKASTRELFTAGLAQLDAPRELLEESLDTVLLHQRLHYERRLPLLAVIATAAPLMGLLGTVTGMVRTFTLITVFGTGNAGRLAGGISEVLVATELGLLVAIPALIAHGYLSQRVQKNLALLEGQSGEFVQAVERRKLRHPPAETVPA